MIEIKNLEKKYADKTILNHISVSFEEGIYGLLGENGAGKTTLFKCVTNLIKDYSGEIHFKENSLSYLPQSFGMPEELNVVESLEYIHLLRYNRKPDKSEILHLLELLNLTEQKNKKVKALSGGMLRRLGIVQAFLGNSKIVILDEPTAGLDPEERIRFKTALKELSKGRLVLLSTHLLTDVEDVCENVVILHAGNICFKGNVKEMKMAVSKDFSDRIPTIEDAYMYFIKGGTYENNNMEISI